MEDEKVPDQLYVRTIDEAYEMIKGNGNITWLYAIPIGMIYVFSPVYIIPFMKQIPEIEWSTDFGKSWSACSREYVWSNQSNVNYKYDYNSIDTVNNWITKIDLIWITDFKIGLLGTLFFIGWVLGSATLLSLGDIIKEFLFSY